MNKRPWRVEKRKEEKEEEEGRKGQRRRKRLRTSPANSYLGRFDSPSTSTLTVK